MQLGNTHTQERTPNRVNKQKIRARVSPIVPESEKTLEAKFRKACEDKGWMAVKLLSQLHRGLPDRMVLAPFGLTFFAEIKTTGKRPTKLQKHCHAQLRELGFDVYVIDSTTSLEQAVALIDRAVIAERIRRDEWGEL